MSKATRRPAALAARIALRFMASVEAVEKCVPERQTAFAEAMYEQIVDGIATNLALLRAIAARPEFASQAVHTRFVEAHLGDLLASAVAFEKKSPRKKRATRAYFAAALMPPSPACYPVVS